MPRKKPGPKELTPLPDPDIFDLDRLTNSEIDIEEFLDEYSAGTSVVEIYEMRRDGSRPHMERVTIDILKADLFGYLRERFGAGKYQLQFKDANRRIRKCLNVDVGGPKGTPTAQPQQNSFMEQMMLAIIASQKPAPPVDMGTLLTGLGTMLAAMKPPAPAPAADPAAMLQALATTFQQLKPAEGGGVKQALDLISAAKDLVPGGAQDDSWPGLIKEGAAAVASVFANRQPSGPVQVNGGGNGHRPAGIPPGAVPVHQITPASPGDTFRQPETQPATEKTGDQLLEEWIKAQLSFLKLKARAGKSALDWVDYTIDNAEEPGNAAILEAMRRGATFQHLLTFDPEIGKDPILAGWFQTFYEELSTALNENLDTDGPGGDIADPGGNAAPRDK